MSIEIGAQTLVCRLQRSETFVHPNAICRSAGARPYAVETSNLQASLLKIHPVRALQRCRSCLPVTAEVISSRCASGNYEFLHNSRLAWGEGPERRVNR